MGVASATGGYSIISQNYGTFLHKLKYYGTVDRVLSSLLCFTAIIPDIGQNAASNKHNIIGIEGEISFVGTKKDTTYEEGIQWLACHNSAEKHVLVHIN